MYHLNLVVDRRNSDMMLYIEVNIPLLWQLLFRYIYIDITTQMSLVNLCKLSHKI